MNPSARLARRLSVAVLLPATALVALAPSAAAKVTVVPGEVPGGGTQTIAVRLATSRPGAVTTGLTLDFPTDVPVGRARVTPVQGWTARVDGTPAVRSVSWSGGAIKSGRYEQFLLTLGPLPKNGRLAFTAVQTYADGSTDRWEAATDGPVVTIGTPPPAVGTTQARPASDPTVTITRLGEEPPATGDDPASPAWIALLGLIPLLGGAVAVAWMRHRRAAREEAELFDADPFVAAELMAAESAVPSGPDGADDTAVAASADRPQSVPPATADLGLVPGRHRRDLAPEREPVRALLDPDATEVLPRVGGHSGIPQSVPMDATRPLVRVGR